MRGFVINQVDDIVTMKLETDYQFEEMEPLEVKSLKSDHYDDLVALYRLLLQYVFKSGEYRKLPSMYSAKISSGDNIELAIEKLHIIIRLETNYTTFKLNERLFPEKKLRSTARGESTQHQLSELYDNARQRFGSWGVDLELFDQQHQEAREAAGKYY